MMTKEQMIALTHEHVVEIAKVVEPGDIVIVVVHRKQEGATAVSDNLAEPWTLGSVLRRIADLWQQQHEESRN
jgi:hypothetical protein